MEAALTVFPSVVVKPPGTGAGGARNRMKFANRTMSPVLSRVGLLPSKLSSSGVQGEQPHLAHRPVRNDDVVQEGRGVGGAGNVLAEQLRVRRRTGSAKCRLRVASAATIQIENRTEAAVAGDRANHVVDLYE